MVRAPIVWLAIVLMGGIGPATDPKTPAAKVLGASAQPSPNDSSSYDSDAERELLDLTNLARSQAGLTPLKPDEGLTQAARLHAAGMAVQRQLSHQLSGEPALQQRLASTSTLHLDQAGENVAYAGSVEQAQESLMHSPPHRENLLNPGFNVAGFGVVRVGGLLYVAQDFGHSLPAYSPHQAGGAVSGSIAHMRQNANLPQLQWMDSDATQESACAMAKKDSLNTPVPHARYVVRYTTEQPESLPSAAIKAVDDRSVRTFSVGTCYARTNSYPNGVYWVTLALQ